MISSKPMIDQETIEDLNKKLNELNQNNENLKNEKNELMM